MTAANRRSTKATGRSTRVDGHRFAVGEKVRMSGGFLGLNARVGDVYKVTARLPSNGSELQYRIRSDAEIYERVMTESGLETAQPPHAETLGGNRGVPPSLKAAIESGIMSVIAGGFKE
jgi:hypothetical protein